MSDKKTSFDLIVIGAGPGGYVAAIRAAQLGLSVACVEKDPELGGTCLNVGCIPSKAMLQSSQKYHETLSDLEAHGIEVGTPTLNLKTMLARKDQVVQDLTKGIRFLIKKNKITTFRGTASFDSPKVIKVTAPDSTTQTIEGDRVLLATGSVPADLPGIKVDEKQIVSSTGALSLSKVPEHLIVVGGGYIGLEMGSVWRRLGSKVTVIEYFDSIVPALDREVATSLYKSLKAQGLEFRLSTQVTAVKKSKKGGLEVSLEPSAGGKSETLSCDVLLSCAGRRPYTDGLGLEAIGLSVTEKGFLEVDASYQTAVKGVYAIGDLIGGAMLAHKAEEEGVAAVEGMVGQHPHINYQAIPAVIYTHPEVASVGKTEEQLKQEGIAYNVGKFPFSANGRARANGDTDGFVKVLADEETDEVYGVHILHSEAGTMIAEAALALEYRASSEDIARTSHAHPTVNESVKEAALSVLGRTIHI